jgi:hypothetical protein
MSLGIMQPLVVIFDRLVDSRIEQASVILKERLIARGERQSRVKKF